VLDLSKLLRVCGRGIPKIFTGPKIFRGIQQITGPGSSTVILARLDGLSYAIYMCDMCGICICGMCGFRGDICHDTHAPVPVRTGLVNDSFLSVTGTLWFMRVHRAQ
jgi:hypothetical protein